MALKAVVAKIEDVAEAFRGEYTKGDDGRFYLNVDSTIEELPAVRGLAKKRDELLGKVTDLTARYKDIDPDDVKAMREKVAELEKGNKGGKNDEKIAELQNTIKQSTEAWAKEKQQLSGEAEKERNAARRYFLDSEITRAVAAKGANPDLIGHIVERGVKVERDGEKFKLSVVDAAGNARIKNSMGEAFTLDDYVGELQVKYPAAFPPTGAAGSGAQSQAGTGKTDGSAQKTIKASDKVAISKNIAGIRSGEITVVDG